MIANAIDKQAVHESFRLWRADEDSLDAQFNESLEALGAYQAHLDHWQEQLVREREELREARAAHEQAMAAVSDNDHASSNATGELEAAHQQIATLKDELHQLEQVRAQLAMELEQVRRDSATARTSPDAIKPKPAHTPGGQAGTKNPGRSASPVLGSIVEQFGKLRQQRALDRQSGKPPARIKNDQ